MHKTLFILLDSGTAIRNILRTDIFHVLRKQSNLRIVIFSPIVSQEFKQEFGGDNIVIKPYINCRPTFRQRIIRTFKRDLWAFQTGVRLYSMKRKRRFGYGIRITLLRLIASIIFNGNMDTLLKSMIATDIELFRQQDHEFFTKYNPDLIFCVTIYAKDPCLELVANKNGTRIISLVHSWDNPTTKGPFLFNSDRLIVWNNILRDEVIQLHNIKPDQIRISGMPQSDIYLQKDRFRSKIEFFEKWGLDANKKLLTYSTGAARLFPMDKDIIAIMLEKIEAGSLSEPCQLLIRLHPKDTIEQFEQFRNIKDVIIQHPGRLSNTNDNWDPTIDDMFGLAELMCYSDVVINIASTISLDAVAFDTPVVNVTFDGISNLPYHISARRFYDLEHYANVVATGGIRLANNGDELIEEIQRYLLDPQHDRENRKRLCQEQLWKLDGKSGERVAGFILDTLKEGC